MSNGGKTDSEREIVGRIEVNTQASSNEFGCEVAKVAVAQICESVGFDSSNESALESLTDIMVRYVRDLGKTASFYANVAGRTECNVFDIVQGLEDLGSSTGFSGASEIGDCLTDSGIVHDIVDYVSSTEEIPFAQPVPNFPARRNRAMIPSFTQMGEIPSSNHIPPWLPAFPDPHTYIHTPTWNKRETDPREDKIELARQRRKAERSLLNLQQRLMNSSGSQLASTSENVESSNPFLADPVQAGEEDVSRIDLPTNLSNGVATEKNHVSALAAFSPALESISDFNFDDDNDRNFLPDNRRDVHLSFKSSKKILGGSLDLRLRLRNSKTVPRKGREDDKDDKKRRAEYILRLSTENSQELTQL